jgi:vacuolar-type H+-ATPase catalytic subunit A/Vma1
MITIYEDISKLINDEEFTYIDSYKDYIEKYSLIKNFIKSNEDKTFVVRKSAVVAWLKSMSLRYPENQFDFKIVNYRTLLE